ncbi:N-terminal asparagine amidohydrolase [Brachionus plicatilis]|uniref:N-terminal asparagine amidohydrolase n=1 Tax=Brachionus plicatilis TaxID=10195 RepID=A0A3M7SBH7_BRAPC|nr:N-terminal asparagine amidohydrolase [Brachionus plicatilis]
MKYSANCLLNRKEKFNLKLCINTELNTTNRNGINYPIIYGIGYEIKNKKAFWCNKFLNKGPDMLARSARHFSDGGNIQIYDPLSHKLTIGPFSYVSDFVKDCLSLPRKSLLRYFSTSPEQEPVHFVDNLLETFKFMYDHQSPLETYFINNKPKIYSKQLDGSWKEED